MIWVSLVTIGLSVKMSGQSRLRQVSADLGRRARTLSGKSSFRAATIGSLR